jgi:hypothetical protein
LGSISEELDRLDRRLQELEVNVLTRLGALEARVREREAKCQGVDR